jgi:hypothetical protein
VPQEIEFTITPTGEVDIDLQGFFGKGCSDITQELVKDLGDKVKQSKKCEFYVSSPVKQQTSIKN